MPPRPHESNTKGKHTSKRPRLTSSKVERDEMRAPAVKLLCARVRACARVCVSVRALALPLGVTQKA